MAVEVRGDKKKFHVIFFLWGGGEWLWGRIWPKNHKFALLSEYLAADLSPDASADFSADMSEDSSESSRLF